MPNTTLQKVVLFPFGGQLQRLCTIASIRLPVMCGAMAVCSMRYGVLDTSLLRVVQIHRSVYTCIDTHAHSTCVCVCVCVCV